MKKEKDSSNFFEKKKKALGEFWQCIKVERFQSMSNKALEESFLW